MNTLELKAYKILRKEFDQPDAIMLMEYLELKATEKNIISKNKSTNTYLPLQNNYTELMYVLLITQITISLYLILLFA